MPRLNAIVPSSSLVRAGLDLCFSAGRICSLHNQRVQKQSVNPKQRITQAPVCSGRPLHVVGAAAVETETPTTQAAGEVDHPTLPPPTLLTSLYADINSLSRMASAVAAPVCIVTGGARGIGRAIATMLGATGAKVLLIVSAVFLAHL